MKVLLFAIFTVFYAEVYSQQSVVRIDSFFRTANQNSDINGNVLVIVKGNTMFKKSYGYANFEEKKLNNDSTIFQLASISKTFTAIAVLQLFEKRKLKLDDVFIKYFSNFPYPTITVRHLLSHTSGLPDRTLFSVLVPANRERVFTNKDIIPELIKQKRPLKNNPGDECRYNNINFDLLALLVEKLSKMTFEDYIHKNIFARAEMKNTFSRTSLSNPTPLHSEAYNYDYPYMYSEKMMRVNDMFWLERVKMEYHNLFELSGDGSIYSTVLDMQKYDEALYSGTLLKPSTLELAFSRTKLNNGNYAEINIGIGKAYYGLGWEIFDDTTSGKIVWHAGGRPGCWTIFLRNITKNQTVILLDNAENFGAYKYALTAMNLLNNKSPLVQKKSLAKIYGIALLSNGADYALGKLFQLKDDSINYRLSEPEMSKLS